MSHPYFVEERMNAPIGKRSICHICPLQSQRRTGHDGPADADHIVIAEAPGEDEENWGRKYGHHYGRPLVGKAGYVFKIRYLVPNDLADELPGKRPGTKTVGNLRAHLMPVIMCRPPDDNLLSKVGKAAIRCCANSARWFINERVRENPNISLHPIVDPKKEAKFNGLSLLRGEPSAIEPYRGRVIGPIERLDLAYEPEIDIYKAVLRGRKPWDVNKTITQAEWEWFELILKAVLSSQRLGVRRASKRLPEDIAIVLAHVKLLVTKQRAALKKKFGGVESSKKLFTPSPVSTPTQTAPTVET